MRYSFEKLLPAAVAFVLVLLTAIPAAAADYSLQSSRSTYFGGTSTRYWPRHTADRRSFRFDGVKRKIFRQSKYFTGDGVRSDRACSVSASANRGSTIGSATARPGRSAGARYSRNSYGRSTHYNSSVRIVSYRKYIARNAANRGSSIGNRYRR